MNKPRKVAVKRAAAQVLASVGPDEWPVCAACNHSIWMLDKTVPKAWCERIGALMYGDGGQQIKVCEAWEMAA